MRFVAAAAFLLACGAAGQMVAPPGRLDISAYKSTLFYENDFSKQQKIAREEHLKSK